MSDIVRIEQEIRDIRKPRPYYLDTNKEIARGLEQYVIKVRIDTAEKIKGNCESKEERIWIMLYIVELKKGLKNAKRLNN